VTAEEGDVQVSLNPVDGFMSKETYLNNIVEWDGLRFDVSEVSDIIKRRLQAHRYEGATLRLLRKLAPTNLPFLNFGACMGIVDCFHNQRMNYRGQHLALEANPDAIRICERNRTWNGSQFTILAGALAYKPRVRFFVPDHRNEMIMAGSVSEKFEQAGVMGGYREVDGYSVETIIEKSHWTRVAMNVDIEGGEYELVEREVDLLQAICDFLLVEWHFTDDKGDLDRSRAFNAKRLLKSKFLFDEAHSSSRISVFYRRKNFAAWSFSNSRATLK